MANISTIFSQLEYVKLQLQEIHVNKERGGDSYLLMYAKNSFPSIDLEWASKYFFMSDKNIFFLRWRLDVLFSEMGM